MHDMHFLREAVSLTLVGIPVMVDFFHQLTRPCGSLISGMNYVLDCFWSIKARLQWRENCEEAVTTSQTMNGEIKKSKTKNKDFNANIALPYEVCPMAFIHDFLH